MWYFKSRNFRGQKLSRFSRFWPFFAKVYAFGNSKAAKRESFFTRNHRFFQKRESFFKRWKTLFSANLKAFHETYKNIAIEDMFKLGCSWQDWNPFMLLGWLSFTTIWPLQKGKKSSTVDGKLPVYPMPASSGLKNCHISIPSMKFTQC